jgi:16S rRNA (cytosine1402-N4)-methyltransferase
MKSPHIPVLLQEVIHYLVPTSGKNFVDATLGFGGHSEEILKRIGPDGKLVGIDQDEAALDYATARLQPFGDRFTGYLGNYTEITEAAQGMVVDGGILADIGVSSYQIDEAARGFSFQEDGPLDMRMSRDNPVTAASIVNEWEPTEITKILWEYGEERFAKRIVTRITEAREIKYIETTTELADIVSRAIPRKFWPDRVNPATKTFQALRIAVNDELGVLREFLPKAVDLLAPGARLGVITFHSLEDRIVKDFMRERANPCTCPKEFPQCNCGKVTDITLVTRKPITATEEEIAENRRSRSAKLRVIEKI